MVMFSPLQGELIEYLTTRLRTSQMIYDRRDVLSLRTRDHSFAHHLSQ